MTLRRAAAIAVAVLATLACALPAAARPAFELRGEISFFADTLAIVARNGAGVAFANGTTAEGETAYVDLARNRILVAGRAHAIRGGHEAAADAIAFDLDAGTIDALDANRGNRRSGLDLAAFAEAPIEPDRFAFPELDERRAYIRARKATVTAHANARFAPASFPTSPGALPVPSYLYSFASNPSFGANALGGATFDQPYGIVGGPTSLLAAHLRYEDGIGATVAVDDHLVYGENAYVVAAVDSPQRPDRLAQITAYQRMGRRFTQSLDVSANRTVGGAHYGLTGAFGNASARLDLSRFADGTSFDLSARTPDRPLLGASTYRLRVDAGFDALPGGVLAQLPDRRNYATVWRHGIDAFIATPLVRGPLGTRLATTFDLSRTWYAFPHQRDAVAGTATLSRRLSPTLTVVGAYTAGYGHDTYPGHDAFAGASMARGMALDVFYASGSNTSLRLSLASANDFPQFNGFGRPPYEVRFDARVRPLPNVALVFGRAYDFGWGGRRFSRWTFSVLP